MNNSFTLITYSIREDGPPARSIGFAIRSLGMRLEDVCVEDSAILQLLYFEQKGYGMRFTCPPCL
jgi:hypothetical protein